SPLTFWISNPVFGVGSTCTSFLAGGTGTSTGCCKLGSFKIAESPGPLKLVEVSSGSSGSNKKEFVSFVILGSIGIISLSNPSINVGSINPGVVDSGCCGVGGIDN